MSVAPTLTKPSHFAANKEKEPTPSMRVHRRKLTFGGGLVVFTLLLLALALAMLVFVMSRSPKPLETSFEPCKGAELLYKAGVTRAHPELCSSNGTRIRLVILVASAPNRFMERSAVRNTWGHAALRSDVVVAFVSGLPTPDEEPRLAEEDVLYGDLIHGRFPDASSNGTSQSILMFEWKEAYCPLAPFLLKTDDDTFVNVERVLQFTESKARRLATNTVWGLIVSRGEPARLDRLLHRRYMPALYEQRDTMLYIMDVYLATADVAGKIAREAKRLFVKQEEFFITGTLAKNLDVWEENVDDFLRVRGTTAPCEARRWLVLRGMSCRNQMDLWHNLHDERIKCRPVEFLSSIRKNG